MHVYQQHIINNVNKVIFLKEKTLKRKNYVSIYVKFIFSTYFIKHFNIKIYFSADRFIFSSNIIKTFKLFCIDFREYDFFKI